MSNKWLFENVTLKFWHGGSFKNEGNGELVYMGGQGRTFQVAPDELCYWELILFAKKCGYSEISGIYYLVPGMSLANGLRKIVGDPEVFDMGEIVMKCRCIDVYVLHSPEEPQLSPKNPTHTITYSMPEHTSSPTSENIPASKPTKPKKLTPKRGPQSLMLGPPRRSPRKQMESSVTTPVVVPGPTVKRKAVSKASTSSHACNNTLTQPSNNANPISTLATENQTLTQEHTVDPSEVSYENSLSFPYLSDPYVCEDNRPDSPQTLKELGGVYTESEDESDPEFMPNEDDDEDISVDTELDEEVENVDCEVDEGIDRVDLVTGESDNSDEEVAVARERVTKCNKQILEIASQLQREACEGRFGGSIKAQSRPQSAAETSVGGYVSEYEDSEDEIHTPPNTDDENDGTARKGRRGMIVSQDADFSTFTWAVGQRFANRGDFKQAVSRYAIMQGRDLSFVMSNKNRQQHVGVRCVDGCPFYLYGSWHSRNATFLVKRVDGSHTCHRNMNKNRQLKSTWAAREMLEVFKARPHWPAKDIIEAIRRSYKVIVKKDFAYKVKYHAHRMLHGSMKEHYMKVERYIQAVKGSSSGTTIQLVVDTSKQTNPPIFQRLYTCFEGIKQGWKEGCRRVICVDAAFLKTFLGGQILSAVGRDPNEQMYPLAWAIAEGENNSSWTWFISQLQTDLELGDGSGIAIISDEHQVNTKLYFVNCY